MKILSANLLAFDTETTGVDPEQARVVEFGAAWRGEQRVQQFNHFVNPGIPIPREASQIHGITDDMVADVPSFADLAPAFAEIMHGKVLVGYNAVHYDGPLLNAEYARAGFPTPCIVTSQVLDPIYFARWFFRHLRDRTLTAMCRQFDVTLTQAHSAAADATATLELLLAMIHGGYIPHDFETALDTQARFARVQADEHDRWSYWLYRDRNDGTLMMGAGKNCGTPLSQVNGGTLTWLVENLNDLHPGARNEFEDELRRRRGESPRQLPVQLFPPEDENPW